MLHGEVRVSLGGLGRSVFNNILMDRMIHRSRSLSRMAEGANEKVCFSCKTRDPPKSIDCLLIRTTRL